jgi:hypothetical protein
MVLAEVVEFGNIGELTRGAIRFGCAEIKFTFKAGFSLVVYIVQGYGTCRSLLFNFRI